MFHRDHPEDLHLVRRRTCPGVDGRKQRFSRFSAQKLSRAEGDSSDDDSSLGDSSGDERDIQRKRALEDNHGSNSKRARRSLWYSGNRPSTDKVVLDTSVISNSSTSPTSVFEAHQSLFQKIDDDESSANKKNNRMEAIEQAMIVSEVASKLEEHVKKALKGKSSSRARRGNAGIVTPPFGSYQKFEMNTRDLITYDDEYEHDEEEEDICLVVSDADDETVSESSSILNPEAFTEHKIPKDLLVAPVQGEEEVKRICNEIRKRAQLNFYNSDMIHACANVAEFFMSTPPSEDSQAVSKKVLDLLDSSGRLASDFHFYRAALHPDGASDMMPLRFEQHHAEAFRRRLEAGASKLDSLREFKIYCVNLIYTLLGKNGSFDIQQPFSKTDQANLLQTAEAWSKSIGATA